MATVRLPTERIKDWQTFHEVCREVFGFPGFYGMNMDAWIDCMSNLREDVGMTRFLLTASEKMHIEVEKAEDFKSRLPEVYRELCECSSIVNHRYAAVGEASVLELILLYKHLVFVYGSLRRGCANAMAVRFPNAQFVGEGKVGGSLYDLGAYPGLLLNESNSLVIGELFEVDDETLDELDEFEASSNYWRKQVEVLTGTDRKRCWIYAPDHNPDFYSNRTLITSGDWIDYAKTKTDWPADPGA